MEVERNGTENEFLDGKSPLQCNTVHRRCSHNASTVGDDYKNIFRQINPKNHTYEADPSVYWTKKQTPTKRMTNNDLGFIIYNLFFTDMILYAPYFYYFSNTVPGSEWHCYDF